VALSYSTLSTNTLDLGIIYRWPYKETRRWNRSQDIHFFFWKLSRSSFSFSSLPCSSFSWRMCLTNFSQKWRHQALAFVQMTSRKNYCPSWHFVLGRSREIQVYISPKMISIETHSIETHSNLKNSFNHILCSLCWGNRLNFIVKAG